MCRLPGAHHNAVGDLHMFCDLRAPDWLVVYIHSSATHS